MSTIQLPFKSIESLLNQCSDLFFILDAQGESLYDNMAHVYHIPPTVPLLLKIFSDQNTIYSKWSDLMIDVKTQTTIERHTFYPFYSEQHTKVKATLMHHTIDEHDYLMLRMMDTSKDDSYEILQQTNQKLSEKLNGIEKINEHLASVSKAKDDFLASMSHELRTPLNSILGLSEALLESVYGRLNIEQSQSIRHIEDSGKHLLALISDILDISKIRAGGLTLNLSEVDVESICSEVIQYFKPEMKRKQLAFSLSMEGNVYTLKADERWLKQMLMNLLSNAVKFTPVGRKIGLTIRGDLEKQTLQLSVWDHGIGIKKNDHHKLFQSFVQLDSSLARAYQGTGLGLSIVRSVMELHGGTVEFESEYNIGSTFHLRFPWKPLEMSNDNLTPAPTDLTQVLLIEDSEIDAEKVKRYLTEMNVEVHWDNTGAQAVQQASAIQPEVIILDLHLPETTGWELLKKLKVNPKTSNIPVVICSVLDPQESKLDTQYIQDYLVKPLSRRDLRRSLRICTQKQIQKTLVVQPKEQGALKKILIVDDNLSNIQLVYDYLKRKGYHILTAEDGYQAIQVTRATHPDLILMDVQMPHMDGIKATSHIKADPQLKDIPIFALTALAMPGDRERCLDAGMDYYFTKPVSLRNLYKKIHSTLGA